MQIKSADPTDQAASFSFAKIECQVTISQRDLRAMLDEILNTGKHPDLHKTVVDAVRGARAAGRLQL
jgi:hypothetical protein